MKNIRERVRQIEEELPVSSPERVAKLTGELIKLKRKFFK